MGGLPRRRRRRPVVRGHGRVGQDPRSPAARSTPTRRTAGPPGTSCTSTGSATARGRTSRCAADSAAAWRSARAPPTCSRGSVRGRLRAGDVVAVAGERDRADPGRRRRAVGRAARRASSRSTSPRVRGRTGSRHPPARRCSRPSGPSRTTPIASAMRLDGPPLQRAGEGELPSEGMVPGAIQVPPSGPADDPARRRSGDRRLSGHRRGDGCRARPAGAGAAGHRHPVPPRALSARSGGPRPPARVSHRSALRPRTHHSTRDCAPARRRLREARARRPRRPSARAPRRSPAATASGSTARRASSCGVCTRNASASNTPMRWRMTAATAESVPARSPSPRAAATAHSPSSPYAMPSSWCRRHRHEERADAVLLRFVDLAAQQQQPGLVVARDREGEQVAARLGDLGRTAEVGERLVARPEQPRRVGRARPR